MSIFIFKTIIKQIYVQKVKRKENIDEEKNKINLIFLAIT